MNKFVIKTEVKVRPSEQLFQRFRYQ